MEEQTEKPKLFRYKGRIIDVQIIAPSVKHIVIETPSDFSFVPGQFVSLILPKEGKELRRSYSIASLSDGKNIELCIKILKKGQATPLIDTFQVGDMVEVMGPLGRFILNEKSLQKDIVFVATGTGITPFRPMVDFLLKKGFNKRIILVAGYRTEKDRLYHKEFDILAEKYNHFLYHTVLSRSETKEKEYVQDVLERIAPSYVDYYICGLKEMVFGVKELLLQKGIPQEDIYFERYD